MLFLFLCFSEVFEEENEDEQEDESDTWIFQTRSNRFHPALVQCRIRAGQRIFLAAFAVRRRFTGEVKMKEVQTLLAEYVGQGSETAFREIVDRYINFVYCTARRCVGGDAHLAQDVTQAVFVTASPAQCAAARDVGGAGSDR